MCNAGSVQLGRFMSVNAELAMQINEPIGPLTEQLGPTTEPIGTLTEPLGHLTPRGQGLLPVSPMKLNILSLSPSAARSIIACSSLDITLHHHRKSSKGCNNEDNEGK